MKRGSWSGKKSCRLGKISHCLDCILPPMVGGFVLVEGLGFHIDGDFAAKGGLAFGFGRDIAEEGDSFEVHIAIESVASQCRDRGRDEIVGHRLAVHKSSFGYFGQSLRDDKMAHIVAILEDIGTHLYHGIGHNYID